MDNTAEKPISKAIDQIIKEAKRIEESSLYSSKGHFVSAQFWTGFHLIVGIPMILCAAGASASALAKFDKNGSIIAILSIAATALSALVTFLNPNEKANIHLNSGNNYDSLQNRVRMFWSIDCWREESEQVLTEKLKYFSEQKDKLNQTSPQIPWWVYKIARIGIRSGEADYKVDKN